MIRAVFTDVDGTLLNADRQLSERTIRAIRSIAENITVVLASSRMPSAMRHLQAEMGIEHHPIICYNGGYVLSSGTGNDVRSSHVIPLDICSGIVGRASNGPIHISLYHADDWYARKRDKWTDREETITKVNSQVRAFEDVLSEWKRDGLGAHKIMCMGEADDIAEFYQWLDQHYGEMIHIYRSRPTYLELAPKEISKASAMTLIMRDIVKGNDSEAMAFGDNYNDVEMLRDAGIGIAVDNAVAEARAVANEITGSGKHDGVAVAIEKHFGLTWP
jgi:Cof subfamily protein (haloacid dehalogenase superfamily)